MNERRQTLASLSLLAQAGKMVLHPLISTLGMWEILSKSSPFFNLNSSKGHPQIAREEREEESPSSGMDSSSEQATISN